MNVLLMDAQIESSEKECAVSMGQKPNDAASMTARMASSREECVSGMEQRKNDAVSMAA